MHVKLPFDPIAEARRNWTAVDWPAADAMVAATAVTRVHQLVLGAVNEALRPHDLTFARFEVLALLSFTRTGALPLGKIGERLQVHPASVTNLIDRLERVGLVERRPHPDDGRAILATITDEGRRVATAAARSLGAAQFGLDAVDDDDVRSIGAVLRPVRSALGDF